MAAKSRAKSRHGGRRAGAGRKPKAVTKLRSEIVAEADKSICDELPRLIGNMVRLANGGYPRVEERWEPVEIEVPGEDGAPSTRKTELVLVERKVSTADADRAANQYLIDRVLGKPKQAVEMSGPNGGAIPLSIEQSIAKIYGGSESDA